MDAFSGDVCSLSNGFLMVIQSVYGIGLMLVDCRHWASVDWLVYMVVGDMARGQPHAADYETPIQYFIPSKHAYIGILHFWLLHMLLSWPSLAVKLGDGKYCFCLSWMTRKTIIWWRKMIFLLLILNHKETCLSMHIHCSVLILLMQNVEIHGGQKWWTCGSQKCAFHCCTVIKLSKIVFLSKWKTFLNVCQDCGNLQYHLAFEAGGI